MIKPIPSLKEAATRLVEKMETIHKDPRYKAVWELSFLHGQAYIGPTYDEELADLKKALVLEAVFTPLDTPPTPAAPGQGLMKLKKRIGFTTNISMYQICKLLNHPPRDETSSHWKVTKRYYTLWVKDHWDDRFVRLIRFPRKRA